MKRLIALMIVLMCCVSCASRPMEGWTKANTMLAVANAGLLTVDWLQTKEIARNEDYVELNPILGEHPSQSDVDIYMLSSIVVTTIAPMYLKPRWREVFQGIVFGIEAGAVSNNFKIGVRF